MGRAGRFWACCHPDVHHRTHWCPSTRCSSRGNSDKPNLPIKSKRKPALQITHQINQQGVTLNKIESMKQINSNPNKKQFGPVPIFSIAASMIMVVASVSQLHSQGSASLAAGALYFGNEVLRDDVSLTARLESYNYLFLREYEGAFYESSAYITSKVNMLDNKVTYEYAREVYGTIHGMIAIYARDAKTPFAPMSGGGLSPEELEAEAVKGGVFPQEYFLGVRSFSCNMANANWKMTEESDFAYNITWKYTPKENGEWWWRNDRHFQLTLSNWKNQQMSCGEYYPENSAYFTTKFPIRKMDKTGGLIEALPYDSLVGRVNISANTRNAGFIFEPINKRP